MYQNMLCIHFCLSRSPGTARYLQNIRTLCVLTCFWCAYCSVAFFCTQTKIQKESRLTYLSLPFTNSLHFFFFFCSSHFYFSFFCSPKISCGRLLRWIMKKSFLMNSALLWWSVSSADQRRFRHSLVLTQGCWTKWLFLQLMNARLSVSRGSWIVNNDLLWILCNYHHEFLINLAPKYQNERIIQIQRDFKGHLI